jgi:dinuclear metal center YbgI/SA1388 family protein
MSVDRAELVVALDELLNARSISDYCPNGLQVEGSAHVARVATAVTACQAAIDQAIAWQADLLLVHHGYFWKGESEPLVGMKRRRIGALLGANINMMAYHLPLDYHPELGNNTGLGRLLQSALPPFEMFVGDLSRPIWQGVFAEPCDAQTLHRGIEAALGKACLWVEAGESQIQRFGWCTGGAQNLIDQAAQLGLDAFISGEISEKTTHSAREQGLHFFAAGHHATERSGVQALGAWLAERFGLEHRFIDVANPA